MREIEGLLDYSVNKNKKAKKTTHIRLYQTTKDIIAQKAKEEEMTVPKYLKEKFERKLPEFRG